MTKEISSNTPAHLGRDRRLPPGRSMIGGATIILEGRLADILAAAADVAEADRDLLWIALEGRDRNLRWLEIAALLRDENLWD